MPAPFSIAQIGKDLLLEDPFTGGLWLAFAKKWMASGDIALGFSSELGTILHVGPAFAKLTTANQVVRVRHECLHALLGHPARQADYADWPAFRIAADWTVVALSGEQLPGALRPADPRLLNPQTTLEERYQYLLDHPGLLLQWQKAEARLYRYRFWSQLNGRAAAMSHQETTRLRRILHQQIDLSASPGQEAGWLNRWLAQPAHSGGSTVPWRRILYTFLHRTGYTRLTPTNRRPSRRYGQFPGHRIARYRYLVAIVDTSASISTRQWQRFFGELDRIGQYGDRIDIIEADVVVQRQWRYFRGVPPQVKGGGGTAFDAALRRAQELQPDAILYFSDGQGPVPYVRPEVPLLWVLTQSNAALPGRQLLLS